MVLVSEKGGVAFQHRAVREPLPVPVALHGVPPLIVDRALTDGWLEMLVQRLLVPGPGPGVKIVFRCVSDHSYKPKECAHAARKNKRNFLHGYRGSGVRGDSPADTKSDLWGTKETSGVVCPAGVDKLPHGNHLPQGSSLPPRGLHLQIRSMPSGMLLSFYSTFW